MQKEHKKEIKNFGRRKPKLGWRRRKKRIWRYMWENVNCIEKGHGRVQL